MTEHERIWLEPAGASDRCWCQDNQWGDEGVEYVLASTLESLQRENEERSAWIKAATTEITKVIGGGSEMFTKHGDEFRVDPAFVASFIKFRRERHAESKKASIQRERELLARAEAAESEVKRYSVALIAAKTRMRNCRGAIESNQLVDKDVHGSLQNGIRDIQEALASTGGEHHGN